MRKSHATGWASDAPTPAQIKEFFAQVEAGRITKNRLQSFLRDSGATTSILTDAETMAMSILGHRKMLGYQDVCRTWRCDLPDEPLMPYTEEILREVAEANAAGMANWRLAYVTGHDLRSQREEMGWNREKQPCFDPDWAWWLDKEQDTWATQSVEPGYCLFDYTKRYSSMPWQSQADEIGKLGELYERAEERAVSEICFSNFLLNSNERLLPNWYHWGQLRSALDGRVCVGCFDQDGFYVNSYWTGNDALDYLGVVVSWMAA